MTKIVPSALAEQETIIERNLSSFIEVGTALMKIRDEELFREAGFDGFVEYLESKPWGISERHAYRQIEAANVAELTHVANVRQAEALAPLMRKAAPEVVKQVYDEVVEETGGKPTAKKIKEKVAEMLPPKKKAKVVSTRGDAKIEENFWAAIKAVEVFHRSWTPDAFRGLSPKEAEKRLGKLDSAVEALLEIRPEIEHRSKPLQLVG